MIKRILVAGSANTDVVLKLPKAIENGESLIADSQLLIPGGKGANRAAALARLGANPLFACCLGNELFAEKLLEVYRSEKLDTSLIFRKDSATGTAYILIDNKGSNRIVVYPGANALFGEAEIKAAAAVLPYTSVLSAELEIPPESVERLMYEAKKEDVPVILDAAPIRENLTPELFCGAYVLSPNESEARALTGIDIQSEYDAKEALRLLYSFGVKYALIKLGEKGSMCYDGSRFFTCKAVNIGLPVADTTAAGDCYMAALAKSLSDGKNIEEAMRFASAAAGISVTRHGALPSLPTLAEVEEYI